ncbi:hypothetical protein [Sphingomonas sp.]|jgi:hypothetical protein|uniref:hypothetical protein n=1 Tax=Sphingomonas sp. TaxID=28214 RepID=UPI002D807266|nr:hypothetical protein [Sphingomonas sp.]HEU0045744.1 hypothetical protein [Sphingomonas sp.]
MSKPLGTIAMALGVAACTGGARPAAVGAPPTRYAAVGLERVIGQDAGGLLRLFGQPDADVREGSGRKLQFASGICVLDAYLYPKGSEAARVTWLDTRQPDGRPIDRASCVAALTRREGGK